MNFEQLLELLQIEEAVEFEYFENFADLVESEEEISDEAIYKLIDECDQENLLEIVNNYFDEVMDAIPDDSTDIFTMIETIKMSLMGLLKSAGEEETLVHFCEELLNFRLWYSVESVVHCRDIDTSEIVDMSMRDALANARIEKIDGDKYHYDFNDCLNYELDEYVMSYGDLVRESYEEELYDDSYGDEYEYGEEL